MISYPNTEDRAIGVRTPQNALLISRSIGATLNGDVVLAAPEMSLASLPVSPPEETSVCFLSLILCLLIHAESKTSDIRTAGDSL